MNDGSGRSAPAAPAAGRSGSRLLLGLTCAAVGVWGVGVAILVQQRLTGRPTYEYWLETTVSAALITPIALLLVMRRPDHRLSRLYAGFVASSAVQLCTGAATTALTVTSPDSAAWFALVHEGVQAGFVVLLMTLGLLYPTGHLPSSRWWPVAGCLAVGGAVTVGAGALATRFGNFEQLDNPIGIDAPWIEVVTTAGAVVLVLGVVGSVASSVVRYRRSRGLERLQLKWFTFTVVTGLVLLLGGNQVLPDVSIVGSLLWTLVPSAILVSIGVAVFRYRLLEIDRIINRTVSYAIVSALLLALYGGAVFLLTPLLAGWGGGSNVAVAAATLLVAAAFGPLRSRVQSAVDRRFNRDRYDADRTVQVFAGALRDETDIEQLSGRLLHVVGTTVAPSTAVLWLASEHPSRT